jgi:hypothetical protein
MPLAGLPTWYPCFSNENRQEFSFQIDFYPNIMFFHSMKRSRTYNPVIYISLAGRLLVGTLRFLYRILDVLHILRWRQPWKEHHEDPARMTTRMQLYLGYKYYYRAMTEDEPSSGIKETLLRQSLKLAIPDDFVPINTCTLHAGGDLIPYQAITPYSCKELWDDVGHFFFGADIVVANLESPADFSRPYAAAPEVMLNDMYFNIDENTWTIFNGNEQFKGFDLLSVANNHSLDQGPEGLINTVAFLQDQGIAYTGAAYAPERANTSTLLERNGIKIGFIAATFSFNKENLTPEMNWLCPHILLNETNPDITPLIIQANDARNKEADLVVAMLHMGCAYQAYPGTITRSNIHRICDDTAADVIIAGHPHHAQPVELYHSPCTGKQHVILYSLGDFIAYDIFKWGHLTLLAHFKISKGVRQGKPETRVTALKLKPAYMHATIKHGKVQKLQLLDYNKIKQAPSDYFTKQLDLLKWMEVSTFFETYILPEEQQHLLM